MLSLLKLYRCFNDGLNICMCFFQNPEIKSITYFTFRLFRALVLQKCIGSIHLVPATPPTVLGQSFFKLYSILTMVWKYACAFSESWNYFVTFFAFWSQTFRALVLQKCIGSMQLVPATSPAVLGRSFWNLTSILKMHVFFRILKLFFFHVFPNF